MVKGKGLSGLHWFIIALCSIAIVVIITGMVSKLAFKTGWWWTLSALFISIFIWLLFAIIMLIIKSKKRPITSTRLSLKDAEDKAIYKIKLDSHNPDNFVIKDKITMRINLGKSITTLTWFSGEGSETSHKIDALVNMDEKDEITILHDKSDNEVKYYAKRMAGVEMEEEEVVQSGYDRFGKPFEKVTRKSLPKKEYEIEQGKKDADAQNVI